MATAVSVNIPGSRICSRRSISSSRAAEVPTVTGGTGGVGAATGGSQGDILRVCRKKLIKLAHDNASVVFRHWAVVLHLAILCSLSGSSFHFTQNIFLEHTTPPFRLNGSVTAQSTGEIYMQPAAHLSFPAPEHQSCSLPDL